VCERASVRPDRVLARVLVVAVAAGLAAGSCGDGAEAPTEPPRLPDAASLIPEAPAPQPTASPTPGPIPDDEIIVVDPGGGGGGSGTSGTCGEPFPPPVSRFNVKVHSAQSDRVVLDATPLVGPDAGYCSRIGFNDGRSFCPVRMEGDPERQACEAALVGAAEDTGRYGPTWTVNGAPCDGADHGGASCANHPGNQYLALASGRGTFRACSSSGACGEIERP
jgi:hypothetical protein